MAVVTWSSLLKIIVPADGNVALLTVRVPTRFARQAPEEKVIVLVSVEPPVTPKSSVAPFWTAMEEVPMEPVVKTKSLPLVTVIAPIALVPVARFSKRSLPPVVSPPPPLIVPVSCNVFPDIVITPPPLLIVMLLAVDQPVDPLVSSVPPLAKIIPPLPRFLLPEASLRLLTDIVPALIVVLPM